jgi:hypothetical protein
MNQKLLLTLSGFLFLCSCATSRNTPDQTPGNSDAAARTHQTSDRREDAEATKDMGSSAPAIHEIKYDR